MVYIQTANRLPGSTQQTGGHVLFILGRGHFKGELCACCVNIKGGGKVLGLGVLIQTGDRLPGSTQQTGGHMLFILVGATLKVGCVYVV